MNIICKLVPLLIESVNQGSGIANQSIIITALSLTKITSEARNSGYRTTMPLNPLMNAWRVNNRGGGGGGGSFIGANSERGLKGILVRVRVLKLGTPKKTKMESPPVTWAYLQPGKKWTSVDNFPVDVFDGFKLGKDAQFYDGLTGREIKSRCLKGMGQVLSDFMRIVDGFGSGDGVEVDNLRTTLEQSEKEKALLRDKHKLQHVPDS